MTPFYPYPKGSSALVWMVQLILCLCSFIPSAVIAQTTEGAPTAQLSWQEQQRKAVSTYYQLDQSNHYTESLTYADMNVLPLGIKRTAGNIEVTIAVSDIIWYTTHSELTLFARIKLPEDGPLLYFGAQGIKFSHTGDIIGDASLALLGNVSIPIQGGAALLTLKGSLDGNTGRARELTYVSVDCQGFRELGIAADVEFPESLMQPVDEKGKPALGRVKGSFNTVVKDWNDLLMNISLPPFQLNGLEGFIFAVDGAVFDFSDLRNDPTMIYPRGYQENYLVPGSPELWRGVYVNQLYITLPEQFAKREGRQRVGFRAGNMIIDNNGVTGQFAATGLLPIEEGSASGWRFSVDAFKLNLEASRITAAGFDGQIGLPVSERSNLGYQAVITADNEYILQVKTLEKTDFDLFNAKAELLPNSYVILKVEDGQFKPEAMLHGSLNMDARLGSSGTDAEGRTIASFKGIEFRGLHLKTEAPRFTADYFGYRGELKLMNFPVSISRIGVRVQEQEVALGMDLKMTLSDNMFTGSTRLEFVSRYRETSPASPETGTPASGSWKFDKLNLGSIAVDATIAEALKLKAELVIMTDDPVYGDGYAGNIDLSFTKGMKGLNVKARGMFGRKDFRYWFVDGVASFGEGISVFPPVMLKGFGGGVSYRMKKNAGAAAASVNSPAGIQYVPDSLYGLGVKAVVLFHVANESAVNGEASFEMAFSKSGGLNFIGFYGFAKFAGKIPGTENIDKFVSAKAKAMVAKEQALIAKSGTLKTLESLKQFEPNKAASAIYEPTQSPGGDGSSFSAALGIQYDFTQDALHATFDLYVNAAGGLVRGVASGNRAGWAVLHIDPKEWYIHLGTPTDRLGVRMGIGALAVETGSYLMLGARIPASPPPPQQVADILGVELSELDYMRDLNALGDGRGFAFGSSLRRSTGDMTFLVLYANFDAGIGFDIMLKDYQDMQCAGRSGPLGINGWYANGQAYVYLQGELGVKVNLWFLKTKIPIIKGAAAALMQAKLPNPAYFKGYLGVQFDLLGGLVKGKCRFKMEIGDACELVIPGGSPLDMRMISDMTPSNKAGGVDVFSAPQAAFTMRVGKPFEVEDDQGAKLFRIQLNSFTLTDAQQKKVEGKLVWSSDMDRVSYYSTEVLPPGTAITATVKVGFEQWQQGKWSVVYTSGMKAEETMQVTFTTGQAPTTIPLTNVAYAYPVVDQRFFLKDEIPQGYIQLKRGQSYLFSPQYRYQVQWVSDAGETKAVPFTYDASTSRLRYTLPDLALKTAYTVNVVSLPPESTATATEATATSTNVVNAGDDVVSVTNRQASEVIRTDLGQVLLGYAVRTSAYPTFRDKVAGMTKGSALAGLISTGVINLQYEVRGGEPFEPAELVGTTFTGDKPLVAATAALDNAYYREDIFPKVYQTYPVAGITLDRDVNILGVPPVRALPISTQYLTEVEQGMYTGIAVQRFPYIYNLPLIYKQDFSELQRKIVNRFLGTPQQAQYQYIITGTYTMLRKGTYTVRFQYTTPDGTRGTYADFDYYNFIQ